MTDILLEAPKLGVDADEEAFYTVTTPTGELKKHKRASDYTDLLDDKYMLRLYEDRMLAHGIGLREDLSDLARSHHPDTDRDVYHKLIIPQARMAAGSDVKANIGTNLHKELEEVDRGIPLIGLPPKWRTHLTAYRKTMERIPFRVVERFIEQVVILDGHTIAGTIDRVLEVLEDITVTFPNGRKVHLKAGDLIIGDIKSGKWFSPLKWMIQMACYSQHTATWHKDDSHPHGGTRGPAIGVRADVALVIHIQAGDPTAPCDIHWLDLEAGYDAFLTALEVTGHRAAAKQASCQYVDHLPSAFDDACATWARERLAALTPAAADTARRLWPFRDEDTGHPIRYPDQPTPEQTRALLAVLDQVEAEHQLPLTPPPGKRRNTKPTETQGETK